jgi:hypothetical protein
LFSAAYKITKFEHVDKGQYAITCENEKERATAFVSYLDKAKGIASWRWEDSTHQEKTSVGGIFLQKEYEHNYSVMEEKNCDEQ